MRSTAIDGASEHSKAERMSPLFRAGNPTQARDIVGNKRLPSLVSFVGSAASSEGDQAKATPQQKKSSPKLNVATDVELRRQRNRTHQARYKIEQQNKMAGLEDSVQVLKKEIQDLKLQRQVLSFRVSTM
ncbi:hypothetical protein GN244_ATG08844 [Phytophthora infestans]|uniref:BZIP domain-containing protein n=1 Tax=Phytophthora infestans TaxID=4787 RepID=A0A833SUM2_PHYIN|nr:hypothetical protein GN244_ATG08844 [Phytophthora infestans]KAF4143545.1 hypothetical protein GN958_ATG07278 [Phytophthora infestans]